MKKRQFSTTIQNCLSNRGMLKHLRNLFCLTILLFLTAQISFAQSGFTLTGGYNMSKIKFKNDNNPLGNLYNDYKGGFNIGFEKHAGNLIVGASFLQRVYVKRALFQRFWYCWIIYIIMELHLLFSLQILDMGLKGLGGVWITFRGFFKS